MIGCALANPGSPFTGDVVRYEFEDLAFEAGITCTGNIVACRATDGRLVYFDDADRSFAVVEVSLPAQYGIEGSVSDLVLARLPCGAAWCLAFVDQKGAIKEAPDSLQSKMRSGQAPTLCIVSDSDDSYFIESWDSPYRMDILDIGTGSTFSVPGAYASQGILLRGEVSGFKK